MLAVPSARRTCNPVEKKAASTPVFGFGITFVSPWIQIRLHICLCLELDLASNLFTPGFGFGFELSILELSYIDCGGFESGFGFKAVGFGFGFGFKKNKVDSDSCGFGFKTAGFGSGFGFEVPGFAHHWSLLV